MFSTIPNLLSLFRIFLIPVVIAAFYYDSIVSRWMTLFVFLFACFTDFLDGYLARSWSQTSRLGQALDPVADKMLVCSTLFLLAGFDKINKVTLIPTIVILCREIMVSGLREFLSELNLTMPVSHLAKWKTFVQMASISCLLVADVSNFGFFLRTGGQVLLWMAAFMTLASGWSYLKSASRYF